MKLMGKATRLHRGYGAPSMEGKVTRAGASERGQRTSFNGANGMNDIEGKAARQQRRSVGNDGVSK
jgi:hypothetical protein